MHRRRRKREKRLSAGVIPYSAAGLAVMIGVVAVTSAITYFLIGSMEYSIFFTSAAESLGAFSGGYICGKFRRRHGIGEGILCGGIMYAAVSVVSLAVFGKLKGIMSLLRLTITGAAGGVWGVNSKRPKNLRE